MLDLIVKDAVVVTSAGRERADLGVHDGRVAALGTGLGPAAEVIGHLRDQRDDRTGRGNRDDEDGEWQCLHGAQVTTSCSFAVRCAA